MKKRITIVLSVILLLTTLAGCEKSIKIEEELTGRWISVSYIQYGEEHIIDPDFIMGNYTEINFTSESSATLTISEGIFNTNFVIIDSSTCLLYGKDLRWGGFYLCIEGVYDYESGLLVVTNANGVTILLAKQ